MLVSFKHCGTCDLIDSSASECPKHGSELYKLWESAIREICSPKYFSTLIHFISVLETEQKDVIVSIRKETVRYYQRSLTPFCMR